MHTVRWLDAPTATELEPVAALLSELWRDVIDGEPPTPAAELAAQVNVRALHHHEEVVVGLDGERVVAAALMEYDDLAGRRDDVTVDFLTVTPAARRQGMGARLATAVLERARQLGRRRVTAYVPGLEPAGEAFAAGFGARGDLVDRQNRLRVADLDLAMLQEWVARSRQRAGGFSLVRMDDVCPDELLEQFTELTQVMNSAPQSEGVADLVMTPAQVRDNQEAHRRKGYDGWTVLAREDATGALVGFTELGFSPFRPWLATQGDTGVLPAYRNLGLGRWLKATNALRLLHEPAEVTHVETWNADANRPMLAINEAMGFREASRWQEWVLSL